MRVDKHPIRRRVNAEGSLSKPRITYRVDFFDFFSDDNDLYTILGNDFLLKSSRWHVIRQAAMQKWHGWQVKCADFSWEIVGSNAALQVL